MPIIIGIITTVLCLIGEGWIFSSILSVVPDPKVQPDQVRQVVDLGKLIGAGTIAGFLGRLIVDRLIAWHAPLRAAAEILVIAAVLFATAHRGLVYVADTIVDSLGQMTAQRAAAIAYYREAVKHEQIIDFELPAATGDRSPIRRLDLVNLAVGVADMAPDGYVARAMAGLSRETGRELRWVDRQANATKALARQRSARAASEIENRYETALADIAARASAEKQERTAGMLPHEAVERLYLGYQEIVSAVDLAWDGHQRAVERLLADDHCAPCRQEYEKLTGFPAEPHPQSRLDFTSSLVLVSPAEPSLLHAQERLKQAQQVVVPTTETPTTVYAVAKMLGFEPVAREVFLRRLDLARDVEAAIAQAADQLHESAAAQRDVALASVTEAEGQALAEVEQRAAQARVAILEYARSVQNPDRTSRQLDRDMIAAAVLPPFALAVATLGMVGNATMAVLLVLALLAWSLAAMRTCRVVRILAGVMPPVAIAVALIAANPTPTVFGERFVRAVDTMSSVGEWSVDLSLGSVDLSLSWPAIWRRTIDIEIRLAQLLP
ncbi:MAG: hypothetical protein HYR63_21710 [Proteobacteria bacterium]|nr:hypothetical protein [Pseudomonadota bacterium]